MYGRFNKWPLKIINKTYGIPFFLYHEKQVEGNCYYVQYFYRKENNVVFYWITKWHLLTHTEPFAGFMQSNVRPLEESTNSPLINNWLGMCTVMLFTSMSTYKKQNKYTIFSNNILLLSRKLQFILLAASFYLSHLVSHCTRIWTPQSIS